MSGVHHRDEDEILELLRGEGGRVTTGRRAIVRALLGGDDHHVTAEAVARAVQAEHPDIHLSTVYRTLESLEALGVLERVSLGSASAVYHLADHRHHHLVCTACGSITEAHAADVAALVRRLEQRYGFAPAARLVVNGTCAACRRAGR